MFLEILTFVGLLVLGGILAVVSGVSLARLGRRGEAQPQPLVLSPLLLLLALGAIVGAYFVAPWILAKAPADTFLRPYCASAVLLAVPILLLRIFGQAPVWCRHGQLTRRLTWSIRVWLLAMPGLLAVVLVNDFVFAHWLPGPPPEDPLNFLVGLAPSEIAWVALFVCVILPILEEMLFRGYLFRGLAGDGFRLSAVRALAISSLLFALSHRAEMILPAFYLGALLAWLDWRGADLRLCMIAHMVHNAFFFSLAMI